MTIRTVTSHIVNLHGSARADDLVTFRLLDGMWTATEHAPQDIKTAVIDEDGNISIELYCPANYECNIASALLFRFALPDSGAATTLEALHLAGGPPVEVESDLQVLIDAHTVAADPHPGYLTSAEGVAAFAPIAHVSDTANPHVVTAAQVGSYTTAQANTLLAGKANTATTLAGYGITDAVKVIQIQPGSAQEVRALTLQPALAGSAPFTISIGNTIFNGHDDPVMNWGYNLLPQGGLILASEHALAWHIEANYDDGTADRKMEYYLQYANGDGLNNIRPIFGQINRTTNASTMELNTNQVSFNIPNTLVPANNRQSILLSDSTITIYGVSTGPSTLDVQAGTAQKGFLKLGYNGTAGNIQVYTGASVNFGVFQINSQVFNFGAIQQGVAAPALGIGIAAPAAHLHVKVAANAALYGILVDAHASQAISMQEWRDSAGTTIYSRINKAGYITTRKNAAPADADILVAGECMLWYDSTNGASALKIKAKQADGTVKTATVALA